ncbi:MAG: hypothetical protein K0S41_1777 [Anaerocolumna sp.]|jgi:hypothetical protein|nr:hypothetical protein [Anaerocolumna sp.]
MKQINHKVDLCIVGGGMAGICAAIAAARHGISVVLMHDRPVLGGNASSEIRMWICGAHGENNRETGILEEIQLENLYRNPTPSYSIWDSVLYEKVKAEKNIKLLLNCSCIETNVENNIIKSIKGWQLTTETWYTVEARYFTDCSGDSILAELSGAEYRIGREAKAEFNESIEPEVKDKKTMGMSCLFQIRETDRPQTFISPTWAEKYPTDNDLPYREHDTVTNFWWIELGGEDDSIHDTEELRDKLLRIVFGIWDHMKNYGDHGMENWVIDWIGFLPGKRESRRCMGDYILTQNDVEAEGKFDDIVAYGGWSMDDHFPEGFCYKLGYPTIFHAAPSPFGIPYRCLYSRNINNLFFAGRNISATHAALSATRVMGTCAIMGQAVGTAAAIAAMKNLSPKDIYEQEIKNLQQMLMEDDCYLPWQKRDVSNLSEKANLSSLSGTPQNLNNGYDRPIGGDDNGFIGNLGDWIEYRFNNEHEITELRLVFDSNMNRKIHNMPCNYPLIQNDFHVPETMVREFRIEILDENDKWTIIYEIKENYQRLVKINLKVKTKAIRLIPVRTWGAEKAHIFSWDLK